MEAKILTDLTEWYINKDSKYYNMDSFFGFEIIRGMHGSYCVIFYSKYGVKYNMEIILDSKVLEDVKKEVENFLEITVGKL